MERPVPTFDPDSEYTSVGPRWAKWLKQLDIYFDTLETELLQPKKLANLLHLAGPRVQEIYETVKSTNTPGIDDTNVYDRAIA